MQFGLMFGAVGLSPGIFSASLWRSPVVQDCGGGVGGRKQVGFLIKGKAKENCKVPEEKPWKKK